jgi:hypothetical protein
LHGRQLVSRRSQLLTRLVVLAAQRCVRSLQLD